MYLQEVIKGFARSAAQYDNYADVQLQSGSRLSAYMEANTRDLVDGDILEIGCGTGVLTKQLAEIFPGRHFEITDVCPEMIEQCRARLALLRGGVPASMKFDTLDATTLDCKEQYALVAAAFTLQWIMELGSCLEKMVAALKPGGKMFFSVPTAGSFPEWKAACRAAGVGFTGNALPEPSQFKDFARSHGLRLSLYEETFKVNYKSLHHFLQSLKLLGAGTSSSRARLTIREMRRLIDQTDKQQMTPFPVTYKILFGNFTRI